MPCHNLPLARHRHNQLAVRAVLGLAGVRVIVPELGPRQVVVRIIAMPMDFPGVLTLWLKLACCGHRSYYQLCSSADVRSCKCLQRLVRVPRCC